MGNQTTSDLQNADAKVGHQHHRKSDRLDKNAGHGQEDEEEEEEGDI